MVFSVNIRKGYEGASIKKVTDRVGLTKTAFYALFQNKSRLLSKLIGAYETGCMDACIKTINEKPGNAVD